MVCREILQRACCALPVEIEPAAPPPFPTIVNPFRLPTEHDWPEDADHENGQYFCVCAPCGADFVGHKRRHVCRKCHHEYRARYEAMTPEERAAFDREQAEALQKVMDEFFPMARVL